MGKNDELKAPSTEAMKFVCTVNVFLLETLVFWSHNIQLSNSGFSA